MALGRIYRRILVRVIKRFLSGNLKNSTIYRADDWREREPSCLHKFRHRNSILRAKLSLRNGYIRIDATFSTDRSYRSPTICIIVRSTFVACTSLSLSHSFFVSDYDLDTRYFHSKHGDSANVIILLRLVTFENDDSNATISPVFHETFRIRSRKSVRTSVDRVAAAFRPSECKFQTEERYVILKNLSLRTSNILQDR